MILLGRDGACTVSTAKKPIVGLSYYGSPTVFLIGNTIDNP